MAFKTISLSEDAYRILKKAKKSPTESFTEVVRRASWNEPAETMGEALARLRAEASSGKFHTSDVDLDEVRAVTARRKRR